MALADEIRARRGDPDDPFDQDAAKREFSRDRKRRARSEDDSAKRIYRDGVREGKARGERRPASRPAPSRRRPAPVRKGARQLAAPIRRQVASGTYTIGLVLLVIALYWLLENAGTVSGLLGGVAKALDWIASPANTISNTPITATGGASGVTPAPASGGGSVAPHVL